MMYWPYQLIPVMRPIAVTGDNLQGCLAVYVVLNICLLDELSYQTEPALTNMIQIDWLADGGQASRLLITQA